MSMAVTHFAVGATLTTIVVTLLVPDVAYPRTIVLAGGGWAMLPDLHWVSPVAADTLREFHRTAVWTDLFWFHRTLDRVDASDSTAVATAAVAVFIVVTALAERRRYRTPRPLREVSDRYLDRDPTE